jgi:hypothetical protein
MPIDDRDRQLDRALARRLSDSRDAACPDAEILAAYHERTLSLEEMAEWKEHIASCSRCQEALALVEESEKVLAEDGKEQEVEDYLVRAEPSTLPEAQAAPPLGSRNLRPDATTPRAADAPARLPAKRASRLNWRWVAPVGALAAGVIVWIAVRDVEVGNQAAKHRVEIAENRTVPPAAASPPTAAPSAAPAQNPANHNPAPTVRERHKEEQAAGGVPEALRQSEQERPLEREYSALEAAKPDVKSSTAIVAQSEAKKSRAAGAAPAPSTPVRNGLEANEPAASDKLQQVPPQATQSAEVTAAAPTLNTSQSDLQMMVSDSKDVMRLAAEDHRLIVAPGQKHVWRVGEGGAIARSTDGGKTWKKQNSGVTVDLTSGSATSDKVAWVAGKSGTLLVTADGGKHWKPIPTPITGDLGGVHALDQAHASIWDVSHRKSFLTSDGGETWMPARNQ